ncbi:MAG: 4-hydroxy-3-methylbut-2-enyl diphosphate reductase [Candidatus Omnitrophica bacterium]|jgi:4-hydroxy-3-methylbut-2-enyl diphosphate reductase|nr:4-hydroxy-3-methylbut-2-enyl diphosphate reductase [Candidatus Omnitrophota bacterium]
MGYQILKRATPRIIKAGHIGFCFGVKRAISAAEGVIGKSKNICSLGPIIHNPFVVEQLSKKGLKVISDISQARGLFLIIRSHGMPPAIRKKARAYCAGILDTTCPFVSRSHKIVSRLRRQGYFIVMAGEKRHPEMQALIETAGPNAVVVTKPQDIRKIAAKKNKLALVAQTTISRGIFIKIARALLACDYIECRIFDTICNDAQKRQEEARKLCLAADVICVVGGKNSANTKHLAATCRRSGAVTHHIESADELKPEWFFKAERIGIVSGASTPGSMVEDVAKKIKNNLTRRSR